MKILACFANAHAHIGKAITIKNPPAMKLMVLLFLAAFLLAAMTVKAQSVTISAKDASLESVFARIERQTGYQFFYKDGVLRNSEKVSMDIKAELSDALRRLFQNQPLSYEIVDKTIVVKPKPKAVPPNKNTSSSSIKTLTGLVLGDDGRPLRGASVRVKGTEMAAMSDAEGRFSIAGVANDVVLSVSYIGYQSREISAQGNDMIIRLTFLSSVIDEVSVVSTGYQTLPKERVTGSFVQLDNAILNRRVSTGILDRIEDIVPGLLFSKNNSNLNFYSSQSPITIRGQSTIMGNANPLIVVDNFPYDGDINSINPNDVETITVLKDAAAASIWGSRAGNGVIVISTKKGALEQPVRVSFNSNITVGGKSDLFYQPQMTSADFIDVEKMLFSQGYYTPFETSGAGQALTPVVELLIAKRDKVISEQEADEAIESYKNYDTRNDLKKYALRNSLSQQYALSLSGGGRQNSYYLSAGYDKNLANVKGGGYDRVSLTARNSISLLKDKLNFTGTFSLSSGETSAALELYGASFQNGGLPYYPYARIADDSGGPLSVVRDFRSAFIKEAPSRGFIDWEYRPLDEINLNNNKNRLTEYRINTSAKYQIIPQLNAELLYQYTGASRESRNLQNEDSYFARNMVNRFTQVNGNVLSYPVPKGGILDIGNLDRNVHNFRAQLNYQQVINNDHEIAGIAGYEISDTRVVNNQNRLYGYNPTNALNKPVDYITSFPMSTSSFGSTERIPFVDKETDLTDRYISYYSNGSYTYKKRYILSASARLDRSNIFGVKTNQKGVPLYSTGLSWIISNENFYKIDWLTYLKLRATFGYSGNVYNKLSAYTTATPSTFYSANANTGLTYATIVNPPNPELKWERVRVVNFGLDFSLLDHRISGSFDYYLKNGMDLIGTTEFDSTKGIKTFTGNNANTEGKGFDLSLSTKNVVSGLKWNTSLLLSYNRTLVSRFEQKLRGDDYITGYGQPLVGRPLLGIYSYQSVGLDPADGNPRGYLNGEVSSDYLNIRSSATSENIKYHGSATPLLYGSIRNDFQYKNISLSVGLSYRLDYYFRKNSINYSDVLQGFGGHGDYAGRWKVPGDETLTFIPAMPADINIDRDVFYKYSDVLVKRADHIRLQDISISYTFDKTHTPRFPLNRLQVYGYIDNIGTIWKNNRFGIDPDYQQTGPLPTTFAIGLRADF
ncbi:SusC/RagA family TonB-linked outer membrane protein [Sphingobacterium multivorum]|uniref:SusC/RagA family TonB-linked outer membrane protein n=1 Tax=Sphingobacterium multivorum TaxID=28454 RepID=UPI003DA30F34